ncbi:MAG TPA: hypothetical protein ENI82_04230 [Bacteroidetes bacterium]|nr:hypothetical protein [Bacteroidota bacterium]
MKKLLFLFLLINISCHNIGNFEFKPIECSPEQMPKFDAEKVTIIDDNGNRLRDTIVGQIEKKRTVFQPCRVLIYDAVWKSSDNNVITKSKIKMVAMGKRWKYQPEKQDVVTIQFEYTNKEFEKCKKFGLNKTLPLGHWKGQVEEGVIENVERIWMHPFRHNQFSFTEVAPFPEVRFPLAKGKSWTNQLSIETGWGDWSNSSGNSQYEVVGQEMIEIPFGKIKNCWKVKSQAVYPFGVSYFDYWFDEDLGFVKMEYKNYGNQTLSFELAAMIDE